MQPVRKRSGGLFTNLYLAFYMGEFTMKSLRYLVWIKLHIHLFAYMRIVLLALGACSFLSH